MSRYVNHNNTKHRPGGKYGQVISQIIKDGVCPFCPEQLANYHKNPILKEGRYWVVTDNMYPYDNAKHHVLLIHKEHIEHFQELSAEAWAELRDLITDLLATRKIPGASLMFRFGETGYTGASVAHLHAMLVSGTGDPEAGPVLARLG